MYLETKERTSKGTEKALEVWRTSEDVRNKMEAQTDSTSFQSKPIRLRFSFGLQEQAALKRTPRLHTKSDLGALDMDRKIISRRF